MRKLLRFFGPYYWSLLLIFLLAIGQSVANLYLPTLMSDIVDKGIQSSNIDFIWKTGWEMAGVAIGGTICAIVGAYFASLVSTGVAKSIRKEVFEKVQMFSLGEFDTISTASLITRTTNDTAQIQQVATMSLNLLITAPITIVVGIVMALKQDVGLSWVLVAIMPILIGVILFVLYKAIPLFTRMQGRLDKLNLILDENLTGVRVVRAFNRIKHEESRFDAANRDVTEIAISVNRLVGSMMPIMMFIINVSSVAIIWFGSLRVAAGDLQIGAMFAFLQYAVQILFSLLMVALLFIMIPRAEASGKRINQVLEIEPTITDPKKRKKTKTDLKGYVEFRNVTFSYPEAEKPALAKISFKANPGKVTAIIGGTGSGKSTLVNLIPRFYDSDKGQVLIDGVDVREMPQEYLRQKIGFVPQKAYLFSGTIKDNLRYGKEDADEKEIAEAIKTAQATDFVSKMESGYDSPIAQGGTNVSGGQMQRLSIARALIRKPEIYVFDDTFSALDFKTDSKLRAALKEETKKATVIIVAQRVGTIMDADQIIVLDEGKMVGLGKHEELMEKCDVYRSIVTSQLSAAEINRANESN